MLKVCDANVFYNNFLALEQISFLLKALLNIIPHQGKVMIGNEDRKNQGKLFMLNKKQLLILPFR